MLQNARATAFTVSQLLGGNQQVGGGGWGVVKLPVTLLPKRLSQQFQFYNKKLEKWAKYG